MVTEQGYRIAEAVRQLGINPNRHGLGGSLMVALGYLLLFLVGMIRQIRSLQDRLDTLEGKMPANHI